MKGTVELTPAEIERITTLIRDKYGYDFRNYAISSFKRRVVRILEMHHLTVGSLLERLGEQPAFIDEFLGDLTVNVTEMFRDPRFWALLREEVIPEIRRMRSRFKVWHAGCSSGEEVFSMAIVLSELGVLDDATIIASDLDAAMLQKARAGQFPFKNMELNDDNYKRSGAGESFARYYKTLNSQAVFDPSLLRKTTFLQHDLVTGDAPDQYDLILCRNVMIYFNQTLQNEVLKKFHKSLRPSGYLAIGTRESLVWCDIANKFTATHADEKIYRKIAD